MLFSSEVDDAPVDERRTEAASSLYARLSSGEDAAVEAPAPPPDLLLSSHRVSDGVAPSRPSSGGGGGCARDHVFEGLPSVLYRAPFPIQTWEDKKARGETHLPVVWDEVGKGLAGGGWDGSTSYYRAQHGVTPIPTTI